MGLRLLKALVKGWSWGLNSGRRLGCVRMWVKIRVGIRVGVGVGV
jgi:hypothetical protein